MLSTQLPPRRDNSRAYCDGLEMRNNNNAMLIGEMLRAQVGVSSSMHAKAVVIVISTPCVVVKVALILYPFR